MPRNRKKIRKFRKMLILLIAIILLVIICLKLNFFDIERTQINTQIKNLSAKPSEIFDSSGTNPEGLHIGDFVNYDAGTWTQAEINEIKTGEKTNPVTANGSTMLPTQAFQFGGFTAGSSRNENATPFSSTYNYIKDVETGTAITGWRVFDIEGDTVTLISAGNPEDFYQPYKANYTYGYMSEYIFTGKRNPGWNSIDDEWAAHLCQKRDWSMYINTEQYAKSVTAITRERIQEWFEKYLGVTKDVYANSNEFKKIYHEPYIKYQNIIENNSYYWISTSTASSLELHCISPNGTNGGSISYSRRTAYGVRLEVTLSSDVQLQKTGTKTLTGGNMNKYGGNQTYNVWNIVTDTTPPTPGTISSNVQYTNQPSVTTYVTGASDSESGLKNVHMCGFYGTTWVSTHKGIDGTYDSANNRYYATFNFAEIPNTSTGALNQGEGIYTFNAHAYDNSNNEAMTNSIQVVYDTTPPTISVNTQSCTWRNSPLSLTITAEDPISNGVNSGIGTSDMQYYLSNSENALSGGEWKTYTSGTSFEINPGISGTYYLFIKNINDNAGNTSTANGGTEVTIGETKYIRFGAYQFDYTEPSSGTITLNKEYTNQLNVTTYITGVFDNESGIKNVIVKGWFGTLEGTNYKEIVATYDSTNNRYYANFNLTEIPNTSTGTLNQGEGIYTFKAYTYDNANNVATTDSIQAIYDITSPTFSINTTSCTWRNSPLSLTITAEDPMSNNINSKIDEDSLQYYLSNSATKLSGGEWKSYSNGNAFEIKPQVSGTYYLFIKNVSDNAGNVGFTTQGTTITIDGTMYQYFGAYQFDFEKPTIGTLFMKEGSVDGEDYIHNTLTTKKIYVYAEHGTDALSGHVSTTYSINGGEAKPTGKENVTELTNTGVYFIVVTTTDNAGNVATSNAYIVNINSVSPEQSTYLDYGTIKPTYRPEWTKIGSTLDIDGKTLSVELKGSAYKSEEIDENVNINYSSNVTSTLTSDDIQVFIDGVEITNLTRPTVSVNSGTTSINDASGKNEITHIVQLSNLEEAIRQTGIPYKEWSGNISLKIKGRGQDSQTYTTDVLTDEYGNQNMMETDENGTNADGTWIDIRFEDSEVNKNTIGKMFADFIKPEFTYRYSELDIDYTGKTAKIVFSVTDKYFEQSTLTIDDLKILVDGEEIDWATPEEASSDDNTKPVKEITSTTDVTQVLNGMAKVVGKEYTIILRNLQQTPNNGYDYSGIVTVLIPEGKVVDTSGNTNNAQTITVGITEPEEILYTSPSKIFDKEGTNPDGLHIGDFVNYDAGTWTQEEINSIKTGLKTNLQTANGSTSLPTQAFQFGGFTAGSSRNGNATPSSLSSGKYNYVKDAETEEAITGWRVFDVEGDTVTLISAGNPEDYYHSLVTNYGYISEYILTGNINSSWNNGTTEAENYQKRNWDVYINRNQYGIDARVLTKTMLDEWYTKYTDSPNANTYTTIIFQKIYQEPYLKYQNMIENFSYYWLSLVASYDSGVARVGADNRDVIGSDNMAYGVRPVITLSAEALITKSGTKTVTGGNTTTYGGDQTYNVWEIKQDGVVVDVVDPVISVTENGLSSRNEENSVNITDKTVTVLIQGEDKYLEQGNLLLQEYIDKIKVQIEDYDGNIIEDASAQNLKITKSEGTIIDDQEELNKIYPTRVIKSVTEFETTDTTIAYKIVLSNFGMFEGKVTLIIPEGAIVDTSGNISEEKPVLIGNSTYTTSFKDSMVDFIRPTWKYVNTDTTKFESEGSISFTVKGIDKKLDLENSKLEITDIKILKDGEMYLDGTNSTDATKIVINNDETNSTEKSTTYTITITGLTETGTYSLVLPKDTLIDEFNNTSVATTIAFSNSETPSNTEKYKNITYHVTPDETSKHQSYVHELLSGNTTTYRPSTLGELFNNGVNPLFAEPMYEMGEDGQLSKYAPKSFAGWAEADSDGNTIEGGTIYGLYDEIPNTVTHLRAVWQDATIVFVSAGTGNNSNSGKLPTEPVQDIQIAYTKLNSAGTAENNIIIIMDAVEWNNTSTLVRNATITSLYAGLDYRAQGAELKISSNMTISGDITFDNIKLYTENINNKLISSNEINIILARGITTPSEKYTFGTISAGRKEPKTIRIEAGIYNNIIAGNTESTGATAGTTHNIIIGNKRDALVGNNEKLTITSEDKAIYLRSLNGVTKGTVDFEMYSGKVKGDIYGGAGLTETDIATVINNMTFYGGEIDGDIYGGNEDGFIEGSTILLENKTYSNIKFAGSIYGAGKNEKVTNSNIHLKNFGTSDNIYKLTSIERAESLYIGNSVIELTGKNNASNLNPQVSYTINKIKNALTIYDNTTIYTQRGFNKVGGFNSFVNLNGDGTGTKATMLNTQNKLYTLEGVNLIIAKEEGDLSNRNTEDIWGDVNGMTFFGMYTENQAGEKQYDESLFRIGAYVEGREKTDHNITVDGFYKNAEDGTKEVIGITDNGTNYDWILGEDVVNYQAQLIASASGKDGIVEIKLDHNYLPEATYRLSSVSTNALVNSNNIDVNLIDPLTIPITSPNANNIFGLTVETTESGWINKAKTNIYTNSGDTNTGTFAGDTTYISDNSSEAGAIRFKIHNSANITEENDLGFVNLVLEGRTETNTFKVVISVNLKTVVENKGLQYTPTFTDKPEKELHYTTDSKVDITYTLYDETTETPYTTGDYRVLTTTMKLPAGTRITLKDKVKQKVYYYHVTGNETEYRLSDFIEMDSTNSNYIDTDTYYNSADGYVLEKYDVSIDFLDANIDANQLAQQTYLELKNSSGAVKYNNGDTTIKYNLYYNKNAVMTETISNEGQDYQITGTTEIPFTLDASLIQQKTSGNIIMDTKYYDQIEGIVIEMIDEHGKRVILPEDNNVQIVNVNDSSETYTADATGVIRIPIMEGLSSISKDYKMIINKKDIASGNCTVNIYFFASDNGKHIGNEPNLVKTFNTIFESKKTTAIKIEATDDSRIINKETKLNLAGNSGIDMTVTAVDPTRASNIRVELYKRNQTYTDPYNEDTYTGTEYTQVDIKYYLEGTWKTPEQSDSGLVTDGNYQYIILSRKSYPLATETINLKNAIKDNIATGEYKLVVKLYNDNTLVETVRKTFIITK